MWYCIVLKVFFLNLFSCDKIYDFPASFLTWTKAVAMTRTLWPTARYVRVFKKNQERYIELMVEVEGDEQSVYDRLESTSFEILWKKRYYRRQWDQQTYFLDCRQIESIKKDDQFNFLNFY